MLWWMSYWYCTNNLHLPKLHAQGLKSAQVCFQMDKININMKGYLHYDKALTLHKCKPHFIFHTIQKEGLIFMALLLCNDFWMCFVILSEEANNQRVVADKIRSSAQLWRRSTDHCSAGVGAQSRVRVMRVKTCVLAALIATLAQGTVLRIMNSFKGFYCRCSFTWGRIILYFQGRQIPDITRSHESQERCNVQGIV